MSLIILALWTASGIQFAIAAANAAPQLLGRVVAPRVPRDLPNPQLQECEPAAGVVPETAKTPSRCMKHSAVLLPKQYCRALEKHRVTEAAHRASFVTERAANQSESESLVIQVGCLVTEDAHTNRAEQVRARRIPEGLVEGHGENLRRNQHHRADLQASQLTQSAEDSIDPMAGQSGNPLAVQKAPQDTAVTLLLCDKELQRRQKPQVRGKDRV
jgi:hypothetical protein